MQVTGQTAAAEQSGYVLNRWENLDIKGWRKNLSRTAAFYFTQVPDSYAARTGRPANVGVIGVCLVPAQGTEAYLAPPTFHAAGAAGRESAAAPRLPMAGVRTRHKPSPKARKELGTDMVVMTHRPRSTPASNEQQHARRGDHNLLDSYHNLRLVV